MKKIDKPNYNNAWSALTAIEKMQEYSDIMKKNNGKLWIASLYPIFDNFTSWIIRWKVYTIAWYSNTGKSRFAYSYVNYFLKMWLKVIFFNLEVDKWMFMNHICCNYYNTRRVNIDKSIIDPLDFQNLLIFDDVWDLNEMETIIHELKPDIVFIDFVQNVQVWWFSEYEKMSTIARTIQKIWIDTQATMFSIAQLSNSTGKDVANGKIDFITIKWAWEFIASSDVVYLLRAMWEDHKKEQLLWISIIKNKYGAKPWELMFNADFELSKFELMKDPFINKNAF